MTADKQLIYLLQCGFSLKEKSFDYLISVSLEHFFFQSLLILLITCGISCDQESVALEQCLHNIALRGFSGFITGEPRFILMKRKSYQLSSAEIDMLFCYSLSTSHIKMKVLYFDICCQLSIGMNMPWASIFTLTKYLP